MIYLKQSTASQSILLGPFVDDTDGATAETGLTIANTDIRLSKNGGNMAAKTSGGGTHDENGWYAITLDATDTDTVGRLQITCKVSGALMVFMECQVIEEDIYDSLFAASAAAFDSNQRVDVGLWLGNAVTHGTGGPDVNVNAISDDTTAATNAESFFDGTGYAGTGNTIPTVTDVTNQVSADVTAVSGDSTAADNLELDYDGTGYNKSNSTIGTTTTNTDMRGTDSALLAASAPTNFGDMSITVTTGRVDVASIEGSDATDQINAACDTAIETYGLDHLLAASVAGTDIVDNSILAKLVSKETTADWDDFVNTTDSLQAIRDNQLASTPDVNVVQISGDSTAADNLEADYDGTGYTKTNSQVGLLTATQASVDAIETDTNSLNDTKVPDTISLANINAEVVDVVATDTIAELAQAAPSATPTMRTAIMALYMALRNKIDVTSSTKEFHNDAGTVVFKKTLSDDGTTYSEAEAEAGP